MNRQTCAHRSRSSSFAFASSASAAGVPNLGLRRRRRRQSVQPHGAVQDLRGAISKTAARGEINVLDPGGFGGVTITEVDLDLAEASRSPRESRWHLAAGVNGIIVNAARHRPSSRCAASTIEASTPASTASASSPAPRCMSRTARSSASPASASASNPAGQPAHRERHPRARQLRRHRAAGV